MTAKAALITVHGMGKTDRNYADALIAEMRGRLGASAADLYFASVYYQDLLQENEDRVWNRVGGKLRWDALRKFLLFGFADAAGMESGKESLHSVYAKAQLVIAQELLLARQQVGDGPVVILAQSLGGQVISCYFWDAKEYAASIANPTRRPKVGLWQNPTHFASAIGAGAALEAADWSFLQGSSLRAFFTTGCNIPIFVAAHAVNQILPYTKTGFEWHNFYDKDDVLGWPLADLSPEYAAAVKDYPVNAGGGFFGWLIKSWNPLSHGEYWGDKDVLDRLEQYLRGLI